MPNYCDDCQYEITTPCGRCHCYADEDYCPQCKPKISCSLCKGPTDSNHEYTKGIYVCNNCAEEMEDYAREQRFSDHD